MSEQTQEVSTWITQWQTTGTPEWAILRQTGQRVTNMIQYWFDKHATPDEQLEKARHGVSKTFDAAIEAKFPGIGKRLEVLIDEYTRLRSFDPASKEDLMVKHAADTLAFQALCDLNIGETATRGNAIFGAPVFDIPVVTETHEDLQYGSAGYE